MTRIGLTAAALFVGTVWFANWLLTRYGVVNVGFGMHAPAGVFAVGLAFTLRDIVHRTLGRTAVLACIAAGCVLAWFIEANAHIPGGHTSIVVASVLAFGFSELADLVVYTPIEERSFLGAVVASNIVGAIADSALFLWLAFGSLSLFWGQFVGKTLMVLPAVILVSAYRLTPRPVQA